MDSTQYMISLPPSFVIQGLIEAAVALAVLVWCLRHRPEGWWAVVASVAGFAYAVVSVLYAAAEVSVWAGASGSFYLWIFEHISLAWTRLLGLAVLLVAVTFMRRARPALASAPTGP